MHTLSFEAQSKSGRYQEILPQIESLLSDESNVIANLAGVAAVLKEAFNFFWVGFYILEGDFLVVGPYQGPLACSRILSTQGVCGHAVQMQKTIIVPDVALFSGHIACNALSRSEIVVPLWVNQKIVAVLDIDSAVLDDFDETDRIGLEAIIQRVQHYWPT